MFKVFSLRISQWKLFLLVGDLACYVISVIMALYLYSHSSNYILEYLLENGLYFIIIGLIYFIVLFMADLYNYLKDYRQAITIGNVLISSWLGTIVVVTVFYFPMKGSYIGRSIILIQALSFSLMLASWRFIFSAIALPERLQKHILIIGAGKSGRHLLNSIRQRPGCGFSVAGFVDDDLEKVGTEVDGLQVLGDSSQIPALISEHQISLAVVAITGKKSPELLNNLILVSWNECQLIDMPTIYEFLTAKLPTEHISDDWIFDWNINNAKIYYRRVKRFTDLTLAMIFLVIASPLMLLVPLIIKIDSKGPVFFRQKRLGQKGKTFEILKFRTMIQNAEQCGPLWTVNKDPRITRVGIVIRKLRLDELPQLINIFKGEMSFIGPRPLAHCDFMGSIRYYNYRLLVKPGITGWAQVMFPDGLSAESIPEKLKYDLYYIKNLGFLLDMAILLKTVRIVVFGRGR